MRSSLLLFAAVALAGCAAGDGFHAELAHGCYFESMCAELATRADARAAACPRTEGSSCDEVDADRRVAHGYLDRFIDERRRLAEWEEHQVTSARLEAEQARSRFAEEAERRREEEAWAAQRPLVCAGGESEPACDGLRTFLTTSSQSPHAGEARAALDSRARLEVQRREEVDRAAREERERAARAEASAPVSAPPAPPKPRDTGGHVCCCDGTLSPTCTTVHRGCCSHHGGVCACE
jgi:hypothetical protein